MEIAQEKQLEIYRGINFYDRYKSLSSSFQFEETFENYSVEIVLNIFTQLGYKTKYIKSDNFFKIEEEINNFKFYFHICLKYGLVELIIGVSNIKTKSLLMGDVFGGIFKEVERLNNSANQTRVFKPSFRNYEDLKKILMASLGIYVDFKKEFQLRYIE